MSRKRNGTYHTPTKTGTIKTGGKGIGDAGYGIEEFLSGGRMFHECNGPSFIVLNN